LRVAGVHEDDCQRCRRLPSNRPCPAETDHKRLYHPAER
jgi:hypothetical protein